MPKHTPPIGKYTGKQLLNDKNYKDTKDVVDLFPWLTSPRGYQQINKWIRNGYVYGRCLNITGGKSKHANRWQIFVPDIKRFKREFIQH